MAAVAASEEEGEQERSRPYTPSTLSFNSAEYDDRHR